MTAEVGEEMTVEGFVGVVVGFAVNWPDVVTDEIEFVGEEVSQNSSEVVSEICVVDT